MCHYSYRDDLLENFPKNHCPRMQKVHFQWPLECLILTRNVTRYSNEPIKYIIVALLFTFEHGGFNILQLRQKSKFRKLQIFISQTTDSPFANYRFSFRFIPFRFVLFCFAPFRFANYSKSPKCSKWYSAHSGGGGGTPLILPIYSREVPPRRGIFFRLLVRKRDYEISLW